MFNSIRFALLAMFILTFFEIKTYLAYFAEDVGNIPEAAGSIFCLHACTIRSNYFEMPIWGGTDLRWWVMSDRPGHRQFDAL